MQANRITRVKLVDSKLFQTYNSLKIGSSEEKQLAEGLTQAFLSLKEDPSNGIKIPKHLWPKDYRKYSLRILFKRDLPNAWRLIYTLEGNKNEVSIVILEWFNHKDYEKRFGYKNK